MRPKIAEGSGRGPALMHCQKHLSIHVHRQPHGFQCQLPFSPTQLLYCGAFRQALLVSRHVCDFQRNMRATVF